MPEYDFLRSLVIIYGLSAIVVYTLGKIRVPSLIGFLLAGVLLGPYGLELISDVHLVEVFAEIGIVLLLFTIGMEFSLKKILSLRKSIFAGGFLQIMITGVIIFLLSLGSGYDRNTSIVMGGLIALSSTAIVLKLLFDRAEIDSLYGKSSLGILIFQDLSVVFFLLLLPMLNAHEGGMLNLIKILAESLLFIAIVIVSARLLVPKLLHMIVHCRIRELFIISIIFICLGTAYLTYELGFSLAIGAFIAGLIVSESEYSYQAISDILPFKDSFNGLFFISVGMLMDVHFFLTNAGLILLFVLIIVIVKIGATTIAVLLTGSHLRIALHSALVLAQVGEFAFIVAVSALKLNLISDTMYQYFLSSAIITMLLTPLMVYISPTVSTWVTSRKILARLESMRALEQKKGITVEKKSDHVIIVGFGLNGKSLALILKELEVTYLVLEMNSQTIENARKQGEPIYYGDATSREILHKMNLEKAKVIVICIMDPSATRKIVLTARKMNPNIYILVRTRFLSEVEDLIQTGADEVIPAEFETSIELFSRVLRFYKMPRALIGQYADRFRNDHYQMFIRGETPKRYFQDTIALMPHMDYESFIVEESSVAADKTLRESSIYAKTGAFAVAVKRGNETIHGIRADFQLHANDIVFLIGDKKSLEHANEMFFRKLK
jgi:CPA2 family monovalent cation:H+ antiporter-2